MDDLWGGVGSEVGRIGTLIFSNWVFEVLVESRRNFEDLRKFLTSNNVGDMQ